MKGPSIPHQLDSIGIRLRKGDATTTVSSRVREDDASNATIVDSVTGFAVEVAKG